MSGSAPRRAAPDPFDAVEPSTVMIRLCRVSRNQTCRYWRPHADIEEVVADMLRTSEAAEAAPQPPSDVECDIQITRVQMRSCRVMDVLASPPAPMLSPAGSDPMAARFSLTIFRAGYSRARSEHRDC